MAVVVIVAVLLILTIISGGCASASLVLVLVQVIFILMLFLLPLPQWPLFPDMQNYCGCMARCFDDTTLEDNINSDSISAINVKHAYATNGIEELMEQMVRMTRAEDTHSLHDTLDANDMGDLQDIDGANIHDGCVVIHHHGTLLLQFVRQDVMSSLDGS